MQWESWVVFNTKTRKIEDGPFWFKTRRPSGYKSLVEWFVLTLTPIPESKRDWRLSSNQNRLKLAPAYWKHRVLRRAEIKLRDEQLRVEVDKL